jgi:arsenite-transporting ATPase
MRTIREVNKKVVSTTMDRLTKTNGIFVEGLRRNDMKHINVFTGKGGVGKTSVAASQARFAARQGEKTLIMSTDMAHNLGDIFEMEIGREIINIDKNLDALEIDPGYMFDHEYAHMGKALVELIGSSGFPAENMEHMNVFPGMDELVSLMKILDIYESGAYDRIIVDCAPTGETLAMLKFPELLSWYIEKFFPIGKVAMRVMKPMAKLVYKIELPDRKAMTDIEKMFVKLIRLQDLLKNKDITTVRIVVIPEKMVVEETKRSYMYLNLYNYGVDGVFINRILPEEVSNPFFDQWLTIQKEYISEIEALFTHIPLYKIPWFDTDIHGLSGIDRMVDKVFVGSKTLENIKLVKEEVYYESEGGYGLKLYIPGVDKTEMDIHESATDVIIKIGNFKRNIPKPNALRTYRISKASFHVETLDLAFEKI